MVLDARSYHRGYCAAGKVLRLLSFQRGVPGVGHTPRITGRTKSFRWGAGAVEFSIMHSFAGLYGFWIVRC